jgi:hypothetical protein
MLLPGLPTVFPSHFVYRMRFPGPFSTTITGYDVAIWHYHRGIQHMEVERRRYRYPLSKRLYERYEKVCWTTDEPNLGSEVMFLDAASIC